MPKAARWSFTINNYKPAQVRIGQLLINGGVGILGEL